MSDKAKVKAVIFDSPEKDLKELKAYAIKNFSLEV